MKQGNNIFACSKTDPGLRRHHNEDVCLADKDRRYFLVADGMGGQAGGEVASGLFLETVAEVFRERKNHLLAEGKEKIEEAFSLANRKILDHAASTPHYSGMGCTAELLILCQEHYIVGHVGDSRTYLFRGGNLKQLTHDHSLVQQQVDQRIMTREQAQNSRFRNVLLRAVGVDAAITVDIASGEFYPGDIFLLCTDGLYGMVRQDDIVSVLAYHAPLALKADMLINMANDAGGKDNISVTLAEVAA